MEELTAETNKRRTYAIISHPDAGKTTLTEKLLLYGGAIRLAGSVKARKAQKHAVSDWMEIEKQRGISVTSSVLQFDYDGFRVNILDTPGHQDFSEDTYRTLMAADSAVMLIDVAKGVEEQTKKLFHVCKQRGIPVFTFVNKLDRYGKNPFDLMEEIEQVLGIRAYPMNWPIGLDGNYQGVYNRKMAQIELFDTSGVHGSSVVPSTVGSVSDPGFREVLGKEEHQSLCEDIELLDMAGDEFDLAKVAAGELTPMFFGSAMTNFGVRPFLEEFLRLAPPPVARQSTEGKIDPDSEVFSAFVFKIQAKDTMKRKQFVKGMTQLTQEGAVQVFRQPDSAVEAFIIGVVGSLQFEVLEYRLKNEYGVDIFMDRLPFGVARWLAGSEADLKAIKSMDSGMLVNDIKDRPVALISNEWSLRWVSERNPDIEFLEVPADSRSI